MENTIVQKLVLGIVQGLTEFLPVSSSAHLILIPRVLHWEDPGLAFDVALHLGTLVGVLLYFWKDLVKLVKPWLDLKNTDLRAVGSNCAYLARSNLIIYPIKL